MPRGTCSSASCDTPPTEKLSIRSPGLQSPIGVGRALRARARGHDHREGRGDDAKEDEATRFIGRVAQAS